jgi:hypothetical protein
MHLWAITGSDSLAKKTQMPVLTGWVLVGETTEAVANSRAQAAWESAGTTEMGHSRKQQDMFQNAGIGMRLKTLENRTQKQTCFGKCRKGIKRSKTQCPCKRYTFTSEGDDLASREKGIRTKVVSLDGSETQFLWQSV